MDILKSQGDAIPGAVRCRPANPICYCQAVSQLQRTRCRKGPRGSGRARQSRRLLGGDAPSIPSECKRSGWFGRNQAVGQQQTLFPDPVSESGSRIPWSSHALLTDDDGFVSPDATTLDRMHAAMLFQVRGATYAVLSLIPAETERDPTSSGSPTPSLRCTLVEARGNGSSTPCWSRTEENRCFGDFESGASSHSRM